MKKFTLLLFSFSLFSTIISAQFTTVNYDYERNWFNEGQPLPSEEPMVFKGMIPAETEIVELYILSSKKGNELYRASWMKVNDTELSIIVPYMLRASESYDFRVNFFNKLSDSGLNSLEDKLNVMLSTYIDVNLSGEKSIKFLKKNKKIIRDMNDILNDELSNYRTKRSDWKPEFSELVNLKLMQLEKADLDKDYIKGDTTSKKELRINTRQNMTDELKAQLEQEIAQTLNTDLYVLDNSRYVDNYTTESKQNSLALNVGYGGVYLSGDWDDFTYGASPYLGLSFPLGNSVLGSKFLSNTSITLGVFLDNFEDKNGNKVSGFIVNRPVYLGLDHKLFKFIRVNAGAAFLEGLNVSDTPEVVTTKKIMIRPYIGLSARIDLSISLGK